MNLVLLTGRLTKAPETREAGSSTVATFTVATNEGKTSDGKDMTQFITCEAWGRDAENIAKYFAKGAPIIITGRVMSDRWEDKDGNAHFKQYVRVSRWEFHMEKPKNNEQAATSTAFVDIEDDDLDGELPY